MRHLRLSAAGFAAAIFVAGCGGSHGEKSTANAVDVQNGKHVTLSRSQQTDRGEQSVKVKVLTAPGGSTLAVAPVYVGSRGPYPFLVDTGASHSLVDSALAKRLHLQANGTPGTIHGVSGATKGQPVKIASWRVGRVALPAGTIVSADMGGAAGGGPAGLLGSDTLSRFGQVAIDYDHDRLLLNPSIKR